MRTRRASTFPIYRKVDCLGLTGHSLHINIPEFWHSFFSTCNVFVPSGWNSVFVILIQHICLLHVLLHTPYPWSEHSAADKLPGNQGTRDRRQLQQHLWHTAAFFILAELISFCLGLSKCSFMYCCFTILFIYLVHLQGFDSHFNTNKPYLFVFLRVDVFSGFFLFACFVLTLLRTFLTSRHSLYHLIRQRGSVSGCNAHTWRLPLPQSACLFIVPVDDFLSSQESFYIMDISHFVSLTSNIFKMRICEDFVSSAFHS